MIINKVIGGKGGKPGASAAIKVFGEITSADTVYAEKDGERINGVWRHDEYQNPEWHDLPSDYQQLEYIQSTGTQYINTEIIEKQNAQRVVCKFQITENTSQYQRIFGCFSNEHYMFVGLPQNGDKIFNQWGPGTTELGVITEVLSEHTVDINNKLDKCYFDDYEFQFYTTGSIGINIYLFGVNDHGSFANGARSKIFKTEIYSDNILVRNFIPAKKISTGEIGLYDLVSDRFFVNSGTGSFLYGNPVSKTLIDEYFYISPITSYGNWLVNIDGSIVHDQFDVEIDMANTISLVVKYRQYLYKLGDECTSITGGYTAQAWRNVSSGTAHAPQITRNQNDMFVQQDLPTSGAYRGAVAINNKIDITNYSKFCINVLDYATECFISICTTAKDVFNQIRILHVNGSYFPQLFEFDISDLSGEYYIIIGSCAFPDGIRGKLQFDKLWLE